MVYGWATWFHCAKSRKSTPLRNAIEYNVSPLTTVYTPPGTGVRAFAGAAVDSSGVRAGIPADGSTTTELRIVPQATSSKDMAAASSQ